MAANFFIIDDINISRTELKQILSFINFVSLFRLEGSLPTPVKLARRCMVLQLLDLLDVSVALKQLLHTAFAQQYHVLLDNVVHLLVFHSCLVSHLMWVVYGKSFKR